MTTRHVILQSILTHFCDLSVPKAQETSFHAKLVFDVFWRRQTNTHTATLFSQWTPKSRGNSESRARVKPLAFNERYLLIAQTDCIIVEWPAVRVPLRTCYALPFFMRSAESKIRSSAVTPSMFMLANTTKAKITATVLCPTVQ